MKVTELESKGLKRQYKIVVPAAQINEQVEVELKRAGEQVKIPGFRPGFIPMKILKQRYGQSVQQDVIKHVINHSSNDALKEKKVRPALMPQIKIDDYKEGGDLSYTMDFEAFPELPELKFDGIKLDRNTFEVSEKDIDEAQKRIAERAPNFVAAKEGTKTKSGQVVVIDFKGMIDGVAFAGGTAEKFRLELGSGQFIGGFEDQLIGKKIGDDVLVKVTFPADYQGKDVAGKEATFEVKIHEVLDKEPGTVDEEFAKARGFENLAKLREAISQQTTTEYNQLVRNQLKKQLFDILEETYDVELPEGMVELEFNTIWERVEQAKAAGDETLKDRSDDDLKAEYREIAERRVKLGLLLADTGNRNNIQITREELGQAVFEQARQFPGQERKVFEFYQKNPERADELRGPILEEKAVDFILSKVSFNDKKISLDELLKEGEEADAEMDKPRKASAKKPAAKKKKDNE